MKGMNHDWKHAFRILLLFAAMIAPGIAHAQTATLTGTVKDSSGAVITGAQVTATNTATGITHQTVSNATGAYTLASLPPGTYGVTVQKDGFEIKKFDAVALTVDESLELDATLQVSSSSTTVEVKASTAPPVDLQDAQLSNVVGENQMKSLPLILRDPYQLILLSPGVVQSNSGLGGFSANGTRERNNNFLLDGVDNNDASVPGIPGGLNALNPDSTQEFRVITNNFAPEFGRNNGAIIDAITKSGSNSIHGAGYFFGRYDALGARDFFNHQPGTSKNPYIRNDFGASAGGPLIKNRTFWFGNYEGQRFITTLENTSIVPTAAFKTGIFTALTPDPSNPGKTLSTPINVSSKSAPNNNTGLNIDPATKKVLALFPTPNGQNLDGARALLFFPSSSRAVNDDFTIKVDHHLSSNNQVFARYAFNRSTDPNPFHSDFLPGNLGAISTYQRTQNGAIGLTSTLSPTVVNELRFGANRTNLQFNCTGLATFDAITAVDKFGRGADFGVPFGTPGTLGFGCQGLGDSNGQARFTGTYQTVDNVTVVHNAHTFKFGAEFRDVYENSFDSFGSRDALDFNVFTNFQQQGLKNVPASVANNAPIENAVFSLLGLVDQQVQNQFFNAAGVQSANDLRGFRQRETNIFAQDTWKALPNLTFTYGLRWEYSGVPFEVNNNFSNLFADASGFAPFTFSTVGPTAGGQLYNTDLKGFEPRFGFAWDPFKSGKTSVRGGYGIFRDRVFGNLFGNARGNPPFQQTFAALPFVQATGLAVPTTVPPSAVVAQGADLEPVLFDPNFRVPYSQNWNLGIQRQLTNSLTVDINYVGVKGNRNFRQVDGNPPQPALVSALEAFCVPGNPANTGFATASGQCSQRTLQGINLYFGQEFGLLPFDAVNNNAFVHTFQQKSIGKSIYHGLQLNVTEKLFHGLQIQGAYTYSHSIDDSSDPLVQAAGNRAFPRNSFNLLAERGNSDFDVTHRGVINYIYDPNIGRGKGHFNSGLLGRAFEGWEVAGITTFQSGLPYDIFGFVDTQHTGFSDRATVINTALLTAPAGHDVTQTGPQLGAFANDTTNVPFGKASNVGRNRFRGPGIDDFNAVLTKNTAITERLNFQLRFEVYNVFNRVYFGQPDNLIGDGSLFGFSSSQVGNPDSTTGARQIQFGGKLVF